MQVNEKDQVARPDNFRRAASVAPAVDIGAASDATTDTAQMIDKKMDRREPLRKAAAMARESMSAEFRRMPADDIIGLLRR